MDAPLEEEYFQWLYSRIEQEREDYWSLARQLHKKEFVWFIPNDDNRIEDGRELRYEFSYTTQQPLTPAWHSFPVSMLEMLIALSVRLAFQLDGEDRDWFWELMRNLELDPFTDNLYWTDKRAARYVDDALEQVIWRTYEYSGAGGLFPLDSPSEDQRELELWYQLNAYVIERL